MRRSNRDLRQRFQPDVAEPHRLRFGLQGDVMRAELQRHPGCDAPDGLTEYDKSH